VGLTTAAGADELGVGQTQGALGSEVRGVGAEVVERYEMLSILGWRVYNLVGSGRTMGRLVRGSSFLEQLDQLLELVTRRVFD
jgi:hypothetical protein